MMGDLKSTASFFNYPPIDADRGTEKVMALVMRRVLDDLEPRVEALVAKLRASRRCSDCVHWWTGSERMGCTKVLWPGETREYEGVWADTAEDVRHLFRTAASCDDYEEVGE